MTILFVGSEDIDFTGYVTADASSGFDAAYSRAGVIPTISAVTGGILPANAFAAPQNEVWLHIYGGNPTQSGTSLGYFLSFSNASKTRAIGVKKSSQGNNAQIFCDNGSGTELLGTAFTFASSPGEYDLHAKITGTAVLVEVFKDSILIKTENFTLVSTYSLTSFELAAQGPTPSWSLKFSQVVAATESTIGWKVFTRPPTGDGAEVGWTGAYTNVDEPTLDNADLITTAVAAKRTFTRAALTIPGGSDVKAVAVSAYGRTGMPSLDDLTLLMRKSGVNYASSIQPMSAGFKSFAKIWETDPSTGAAWNNALIEGTSLQFGIEVA